MLTTLFHPAVNDRFTRHFARAIPAQAEAWPAIKAGQHTLIAALTGSGKTLAAFLSAIDDLVRGRLEGGLANETHVLYVPPLRRPARNRTAKPAIGTNRLGGRLWNYQAHGPGLTFTGRLFSCRPTRPI